MKVKDLVEELESKDSFKKFKAENEGVYFAAGFFILNLEENSETIQLDYFIPGEKKIAAFEFPFGEPKIHGDIVSVKDGKTIGADVPDMGRQTTTVKIDIDDLASASKEIILENDCRLVPTKIISILKDDVWNLTCMDNMLGVVRLKINAVSGELIEFNKGSLMDFMGVRKK